MQTDAYELQKHRTFSMLIFQKQLGLTIRASIIIDVGKIAIARSGGQVNK